MAVQAGFEPLNYKLSEEHKAFYFKGIQAGLGGDYQHVERLIRNTLKQQTGGE